MIEEAVTDERLRLEALTSLMSAGGERERLTADRLEPSQRPRDVG